MNSAICLQTNISTSDDEQLALPSEDQPFKFDLFHSIADVPFKDWEKLIPNCHLLLQRSFLEGVEKGAKENFDFRYVIVYRNQEPVLCAYFQIITFDVSRTLPYTKQAIAGKLKRTDRIKFAASRIFRKAAANWKVRLLVGGNGYITGENNFSFHPSMSHLQAYSLLNKIIRKISKAEKTAGTLLKDFYPHEHHPQAEIESNGFHLFKAEPNMVLKLKPEWKSFEDYLACMNAKYRQRAKSAYKKSTNISFKEMSLEDIKHESANMKELFANVLEEDKFSLVDPDLKYIITLKEVIGNRFKVYGYFLDGKIVAFMSLLVADTRIDAHFMGYNKQVNRKFKLYQRVLYDIVQAGIAHQKSVISFGRTALEIKSCTGAKGYDMNLYLKLNNRLLNRLAAPIISRIKMDPWQPRHPFK